MSSADDVLRRRFIAIATGNFAANATYPTRASSLWLMIRSTARSVSC
ncbi:MAG: hypothetical protein ABSB76_32960 [Streptosporangiaceae bacterium]|jgi:hypothetical protein